MNYHFGSKKALIQAVFSRYLDPFAENMAKALDDFGGTGRDSDLEAALHLLVDQIMAVEPRSGDDLSVFMRLIGLAYSEAQGHLKRYLNEAYGDVFQRYFKLLVGCALTFLPAICSGGLILFWDQRFLPCPEPMPSGLSHKVIMV